MDRDGLGEGKDPQARPAADVSVRVTAGTLWNMNKWRYALFGWAAWKVTKRYARRKLPLA